MNLRRPKHYRPGLGPRAGISVWTEGGGNELYVHYPNRQDHGDHGYHPAEPEVAAETRRAAKTVLRPPLLQ